MNVAEAEADGSFKKVGADRLDLVDCNITKEFIVRLKSNLCADDPVIKKEAEKFIDDNVLKPFTKYAKEDRSTEFDGPATLGQSLELREDFYAFAYLYQLRRGYFFEQDYYGDDSNCDSEMD